MRRGVRVLGKGKKGIPSFALKIVNNWQTFVTGIMSGGDYHCEQLVVLGG